MRNIYETIVFVSSELHSPSSVLIHNVHDYQPTGSPYHPNSSSTAGDTEKRPLKCYQGDLMSRLVRIIPLFKNFQGTPWLQDGTQISSHARRGLWWSDPSTLNLISHLCSVTLLSPKAQTSSACPLSPSDSCFDVLASRDDLSGQNHTISFKNSFLSPHLHPTHPQPGCPSWCSQMACTCCFHCIYHGS